MDSVVHFYDMYPDLRKFSFLFHSEYSHATMTAVVNADEDLVDMLSVSSLVRYLFLFEPGTRSLFCCLILVTISLKKNRSIVFKLHLDVRDQRTFGQYSFNSVC